MASARVNALSIQTNSVDPDQTAPRGAVWSGSILFAIGSFKRKNQQTRFGRFVCLFCYFTSQVNSYGHCGTVSSPNHTFFQGKLEQAVNQYFVHILSLVTDNNPSWMIQRKGGEWP